MGDTGIMDNRSLVQKADLALSDLTTGGGLLQPAQAQKFLRVLINEAKLMKMATVVPMRSHKQIIDKIRFAGRVLRKGKSATALTQSERSKPDLTNVELDSQLFKAEVRLDNEVLEDSIEGGSLKQTIMTTMGEAIARDMEEILVQGDTASTDDFLSSFDGIIKQATSNVVPVSPIASLTKTILRDMLKTMPNEFLRNKRLMSYLTSVDAQIDYADSLASRETNLGDRFHTEDVPPAFSGVKVMDIPLFPEDLGGGNNETVAILTDPKNIQVGFWRRIKIETDKDISAGVLVIVATVRFDVKFAVEEAVVKATGIKTTG